MRKSWAPRREEVRGLGATLVIRDQVERSNRGRRFLKWEPTKTGVIQAFRDEPAATVFPIVDQYGPSFVVVAGRGDVAKGGLEEFLTGYRDEFPETEVRGLNERASSFEVGAA